MPKKKPDNSELLKRCEIHRTSMALLPAPFDKRPGVAYLTRNENDRSGRTFCSCRTSRKGACTHMQELKRLFTVLRKGLKDKPFDYSFRSGIWYRIAAVLMDGNSIPLKNIKIKKISRKKGDVCLITDSTDNELARYFTGRDDATRFLERCISLPEEGEEDIVPTRNSVLQSLYKHSRTQNEWMMIERGFKTRGQLLEESFWFRLAYHAYRELGNEDFLLSPAIDKRSGAFTVTCNNRDSVPLFRFCVPRKIVKKLLVTLEKYRTNQNSMPIHPVPLKSIFNVTVNTELDLEVRPVIELIQKDGESRFFDREELEHFRYNDLIYIPELGIMTELEKPGMERKFQAPVKMVLKKSQVPEFLDEFGEELLDDSNIISQDVKALKILKEYEKVEITPEAIDRDWCWLSVKYTFGSELLSLNDILRAAEEGQRYIGTEKGWIDARSPEIMKIAEGFKDLDAGEDSESLKLTRMDLIRLKAASSSLFISGDQDSADQVKRIIDLKPSCAVPLPAGLRSELRGYQRIGMEWLYFLYENYFGGLLCDDMGLGKTHQIMAFLLALREQANITSPFLVVCPTTVLSHWQTKVRQHAPSLNGTVYHGGDRDLDETLKKGNLIITSYGILTRDIDRLKEISFSVAVFDEVQHIKNPETKAYRSARDVAAEMKIGLTGTPIENRLMELKALFDLTVPGYLGSDRDFQSRFVSPIEENGSNNKKEELAGLASPFILRRLKKSVLDELPDKIEDILSCTLSEDQVRIYRNAIESRGAGLIDSLRKADEPVPYMHIFALLNLLKQICNHPALVEKSPEKYEMYESGKWDLFREILSESIESGQKVVVYSQYLGMINIVERYLEQQNIGFASLTGKSRNRGSIIKKFSDDPDCRVFLGSLKAGGVGIDLIAASVVIHYDRWWNAAKEDQATDRVHRIGQKRGVQVFKLVTEGTLEEKISAIISRKKDLMDSVIKEDDPGLLKSFSREELIDLINF